MAWVTASSLSTGDLITASEWNQSVISNTNELRAGGWAIASQAANDVVYASSTTQFARLGAGSAGKVLTTQGTGSAPTWESPTTGDITSVVAGAGMTGGATSGAATVNVIGTADKITVSSDAVTIASTYVGQTSITTLGTIGTGAWQGTAVANAYVADDLTISGGTVNSSVIGGSTPAAATFTQVDITAEGDLRWQDASGGQYAAIDAPATVSTSYTMTLPGAIGAVDQVLSLSNVDGTLQWATPAAFDADAAQVFNDSGADVDFRVESDDNANLLFVDGGEDRLGIGTGTPDKFLHVMQGDASGAASVDANCHVVFEASGTMIVSTQTPTGEVAAYMFATPNHALDGGVFYTHNSTAAASSLVISAGHENGITLLGTTVASGDFNDTSDENLKENVRDLVGGLSAISELHPVTFDWIQPDHGTDKSGFIAQEVEDVLPNDVVGEDYTVASDGPGKAVNTIGILAHAVKAIQELDARLAILEGA